MAKVAFSKLALKKQDKVNTIKIGNFDIEVKQYLPVNDKLELISNVINFAHDENNFSNPVKVSIFTCLEIIFAYNPAFTQSSSLNHLQ